VRYLSSFPRLNTLIIIIFFILWAYSEIEEKKSAVEWKAFVRSGPRFTAEDGAALESRIEALEDDVSE